MFCITENKQKMNVKTIFIGYTFVFNSIKFALVLF